MTKCPACLEPFGPGKVAALAAHLEKRAGLSDSAHVRWLNQNISRRKVGTDELERRIDAYFDLGGRPLKDWIKRRFIAKFFGKPAHPFVLALQHPSREVLVGYVIEHQHFLRQWVRSCAQIIARTDEPDVIRYELDNLATEFGRSGEEGSAHYELLLRMGESLGFPRGRVLAMEPLPATRLAIEAWNHISTHEPWVEAMAAMHSLELIADRTLTEEGASMHYFDPAILSDGSLTGAAVAFLREGYEADASHSSEALELIDRFSDTPESAEGVQATFLRSIDLFDDYLIARLERSTKLEG